MVAGASAGLSRFKAGMDRDVAWVLVFDHLDVEDKIIVSKVKLLITNPVAGGSGD
jgi:hypothetical protein